MAKRKVGRPHGSKQKRRDICRVQASRCKNCGSTERTRYRKRVVENLLNIATNREGDQYNVVVRRPTECLNCGQPRIDCYFLLELRNQDER